VADGAGETVRIHGSAIDPGVFSESAARRQWIMATVAMTGKGDSAGFVAYEQVHAGAVKGCGKHWSGAIGAIGISFLMTVPQYSALEMRRLEKALAFDPNIPSKWLLVAIVEVIGGAILALYALRSASNR